MNSICIHIIHKGILNNIISANSGTSSYKRKIRDKTSDDKSLDAHKFSFTLVFTLAVLHRGVIMDAHVPSNLLNAVLSKVLYSFI